ncbi:PilN domain-containing protein [Romeria aff. gracilis LEGE 07310]|uniref:PilN domain-containing protein n=1 Tax=Vasconcelosia minhoensis LEGE 07310 TaxID=915328 RepID=A0A8J7AMV0_9CYAN|nr:PilN domain-containing protein [Romeria gracilis]MBE9077394.1 PilN domain-containing protein [Romeria aff. gracilis LEGE 07310]
MYGVDINFLNDRGVRPVEVRSSKLAAPRPTSDRKPLMLGLVVAMAALGALGGAWLVLQQQQRGLLAQQADLTAQLQALEAEIGQIETIRQQTQAIRDESQALASVFERIRPWSAIVQDIQNRIPTRTQITSITQTAPPAATAAPAEATAAPAEGQVIAPAASPAGGLEISGNACSFDDVNDFLLTLQNSPFLVGPTVQITEATLSEPIPGRCPGDPVNGQPLALAEYTITGDIQSIPAAELLAELNKQQEPTGLAARIQALQETGIVAQ